MPRFLRRRNSAPAIPLNPTQADPHASSAVTIESNFIGQNERDGIPERKFLFTEDTGFIIRHPVSAPEMSNGSVDYGPDRPLTVMKKRRRRGPIEEAAPIAEVCKNQTANTGSAIKTGDFFTSNAGFTPAQRRFKPHPPLRWFSRQRTSSSGTTCRRYNSRSSSASSDSSSFEQPSSLGYPDEPLAVYRVGSQSSTQTGTSFSSMPASAGCSDDCHLLVPRISVTPEVWSFDGVISTIWAAIEISVQLSRPYTDGLPHSHPGNFILSNPLRVGSVSRFGYLYNLQVDVLGVPQTAIVEVIQGEKNRSLSLGSTMLILAKVHIGHTQQRRSGGVIAQQSNKLIADLESELGVSSVRYLQVRLRYHHSGFPASNGVTPIAGTVDCKTCLETTVTGVIEQQALHLPLGLPPTNASESSIYSIVASYWGPFRANQIFCRNTFGQPNAMIAYNAGPIDNDATSIEDNSPCQSEAVISPFTPVPRRQVGIQRPSLDQGEDPARKIWTEMRRRTSRDRPDVENVLVASRLDIFGKVSANMGSLSSLRMKSDVNRRREMIRDVALRNKRSIGADSLKSLVPSMMNLEITSKDTWGTPVV
ncbi:hypothetical protein O1611_g9974 [Lasiodiplodia mahajangana]|uniref:Uncharacterized protein n=1 Tax=Lasiodiplodia mahajangana TaxID=1108764 RepID=A0ACC2J3G5_9PEZI|nr:hypothetical protein O1611_g9974 [Lasiodiplodia mahajangana]